MDNAHSLPFTCARSQPVVTSGTLSCSPLPNPLTTLTFWMWPHYESIRLFFAVSGIGPFLILDCGKKILNCVHSLIWDGVISLSEEIRILKSNMFTSAHVAYIFARIISSVHSAGFHCLSLRFTTATTTQAMDVPAGRISIVENETRRKTVGSMIPSDKGGNVYLTAQTNGAICEKTLHITILFNCARIC
ncbi:unnamed protein product [Somion occarium]|uniref:Uncharacterized protein n=1 Tax=Somion occarium TaxID=3059160 RepID=A0ABP1CWQ8_9APHY